MFLSALSDVKNKNKSKRDEAKKPGSKKRQEFRNSCLFLLIKLTDHSCLTENLNTVVDCNVSPGYTIVFGKFGWLGESG